MRKILLSLAAVLAFVSFNACKKTDNVSNARTVQNLSGTYSFTGLVYYSGSISINAFDSLDVCERDNVIELKTDMTYDFRDEGQICGTPDNSQGTWSLSAKGDSLYIDSDPAAIKTWDGKTLALTAIVDPGPPVVSATTTLVKR